MKSGVSLTELSPALGVEVRGVDLREPVDEAVAAVLRQAYSDRLLVLFRDQQLSHEDHIRAISIFGPPMDEFADGSGHSLVSNVDQDAYIGGAFSENPLIYHSDLTNTDAPPWGLSLYAMEISGEAPGTRYVNAQYAYEKLSSRLRDRIEGLTVTDTYESEAYGAPQSAEASASLLAGHRTVHPAVIDHPRNGRRQVYCNQMWTHHVAGLDKPAAKALLAELFAELYAPANTHEHKWAAGDLVIWDNIGLQHGRDPIPPGCQRRMRRAPIGENRPGQVAASRQGRERSLEIAASRDGTGGQTA